MFLTIAIPTFNRSNDLRKQLNFIRSELSDLKRFDINVIVSDNCSTDNTAEVVQQEAKHFSDAGLTFSPVKNPVNLGAVRNIVQCMRRADGKYVWVLGDDDIVVPGTLRRLVTLLENDPACVGGMLNFRSIRPDLSIDVANALDRTGDEVIDGQTIVNQLMTKRFWALAFLSALVYRSDLVKQAIAKWPDGERNFDYMVFLSVEVFSRGHLAIVGGIVIDYILGPNEWNTQRDLSIRAHADKVEIFKVLSGCGIDNKVLKQNANVVIKRALPRLVKNFFIYPRLTTKVFLRLVRNASEIYRM